MSVPQSGRLIRTGDSRNLRSFVAGQRPQKDLPCRRGAVGEKGTHRLEHLSRGQKPKSVLPAEAKARSAVGSASRLGGHDAAPHSLGQGRVEALARCEEFQVDVKLSPDRAVGGRSNSPPVRAPSGAGRWDGWPIGRPFSPGPSHVAHPPAPGRGPSARRLESRSVDPPPPPSAWPLLEAPGDSWRLPVPDHGHVDGL